MSVHGRAAPPPTKQKRKEKMKKGSSGLWLVLGDLEPNILGPFAGEEDRDTQARESDKERREEDGIFRLDIDSEGTPTIEPYSNGFFMTGEENAIHPPAGR